MATTAENFETHASPEVLVERLFRRISEVSTLPAMALHIMQVANDGSAGAEDLHDAIRYDAALAARLVRTVNSSYYALQDRVADLRRAITILGFKEIRNLAMTAHIAQLFQESVGHGTYTRRGLWDHLVGVGTVARRISEVSGAVAPREAYLSGLLHDLGLILIDQYLHEPFTRVIDAVDAETPLCDTEEEILGFNHAQLGEYVARQWRLPEHLIASIRSHHAPLKYVGEHRDMVCTIALADFFCQLRDRSALGVPQMLAPPAAVFQSLGLDKRRVAQIWDGLDETLAAADLSDLLGPDAA